ncbi:DNA-processing protein DprA [Gordonia polyisoprenivorans]|uniref:DNA-processing protein DprA n=1 Tax=Gordonia polyisoprenivorans TaxID=84595 RepID=UPI0023014875|nr:DNA-processing protein DprA [Gordonia polyisoprenivorans]WCB37659.1 DNA-processing protein DprA [Gordonia polyisoprenivorans]
MIPDCQSEIERVLLAIQIARTPAKTRDALLNWSTMSAQAADLSDATLTHIRNEAHALAVRGIGVIAADNTEFPERLIHRNKPLVPALFYQGNVSLMNGRMVGVSGSRNVSERGGAASARLGEIVARNGWSLVSGSARGVDTIAAESALGSGGNSIRVLPDGISNHSSFEGTGLLGEDANQLVLSQFWPEQKWTVHGAMQRNRVICGLASTVVVVEAGESGGSLAAGRAALDLQRRLLTFTYGDHTPPGNQILLDEGARAVGSPADLERLLSDPDDPEASQIQLL